MYFINFFSLLILYYLSSNIRKFNPTSPLKKWINWGFLAATAIWITGGTLEFSDAVFAQILFKILTIALISGLAYLVYTVPEFERTKTLFNAIAPFIILGIIEHFVKVLAPKFHKSWEAVFETALAFAFLWAIIMYFVTRKQRKNLEIERLKAIERERELEIIEKVKASLEVEVADRTNELIRQKEELEKTLQELKAAQAQLIHAEKMASLGELTAGIAHEIQNPLNFVNNFSEVSHELIDEIQEARTKRLENATKTEEDELEEEILADIKTNLEKITHHGKRADSIVKGMLGHSRSNSGEKNPTDLNALADEYLRLSFHGIRAKDKTFNADFKTDFDSSLPLVTIASQDVGRVFLNIVNNAFYACADYSKKLKSQVNLEDESLKNYIPCVKVTTRNISGNGVISISDNGPGIPENIRDKIFQPFFTTKPTGMGTGLGLSLSYDIIKAHGGKIDLISEEGKGTEFIITLPLYRK
ncbi:ATP-binding protein [Belliella sp. R4-6]|uniref:histidine kinase n=1 Tax=Belliella alkalica TaxID=1730871 RepID=A0ABS9VDQ2_9BACT|nr:ATP-binding protein [Belliella alkalica]MCH7414561.1 ATP-binding protein [Belliella alkalica]